MIISDNIFEQELNFIQDDKFIVALSGGADSLCLTLLCNNFAKKHNKKFLACFVNHKLRKESDTEIEPIIEILKNHDIPYTILVWKHNDFLGGNLEKKAREARYEIFYNFCQEFGYGSLLTGHHSNDQWETFFMRLSHGSALKGLCSIQKNSKYKDINLIRPLLNFSKEDILETLAKKFEITQYVEDPMNIDCKFERVRWRKSYQKLSSELNLNIQNISKTIARLNRANNFIEDVVNKEFSDVYNNCSINLQKFQTLNIEIKIRLLNKIIKNFLRSNRIISDSLLERMSFLFVHKNFKTTNFCGIIFKKTKTKNIKLEKENRTLI